VPFAILRDAVS